MAEKVKPAVRPDAPPSDRVLITATTSQERIGALTKLRGNAKVETTEMVLYADEIDYNEETSYVEARGNVRFEHFVGGEKVTADRAEYTLDTEIGKFFNVKGTTPAKLEARRGVLTTTSPFSFQGKWAERLEDRYILHDGFITNCRLPNPWWTLRGPTFDIIPGERAIAKRTTFWLRFAPLFYTPYFFKSLEKMPRKSGLLTPNIGNSSRRGKMLGAGYYWAINRSYDATYTAQYFTERGFAHNVDLRGKPTEHSDFNYLFYGVNDKGLLQNDGTRLKQGGYLMTLTGKADLGNGFYANGVFNYLSSFTFRQNFTESFYEAISTEVHSVGSISKHWSSFGFNAVLSRNENFLRADYQTQVTEPSEPGGPPTTNRVLVESKIVIRKLPSFEFNSRDREVSERVLPIWVSFDSSAGLVSRSQDEFQTSKFVDRLDFQPRVMTALHWQGFSVTPYFSIRETEYGASLDPNGKVISNDILRSSREFGFELVPPSIARVFDSPNWLGKKLKHVIEPRASFRTVNGVGEDFRRLVRFDETELVSNTTEAEISLTNRLYVKRKDDRVDEVLSWTIAQRRFFDPNFGGALIPGQRNVLLSSATFTGYSFLFEPRNYSPVSSTLRLQPDGRFGTEWRADYDPLRGHIVNSSVSVDGRLSHYFLSVGHTQVRSIPQLTPNASQLRATLGFGEQNKRGWNSAFTAFYDYRLGILTYATTQVTYNSDCCGLSVQFNRFNVAQRNENQFRIAFAVANIGSFGTLKKQEKLF